jgi:uncharacterized membrane protein required for colicin V production
LFHFKILGAVFGVLRTFAINVGGSSPLAIIFSKSSHPLWLQIYTPCLQYFSIGINASLRSLPILSLCCILTHKAESKLFKQGSFIIARAARPKYEW